MIPKDFAALAIPVLWARVLELEQEQWTCRHCGGRTTKLSEICDRCGVEDLEQGECITSEAE